MKVKKSLTAIADEEQLDEVVVVGPGPRRRRRHLRDPGKARLRLPPSLRPNRRDAQQAPAAAASDRRIRPGGTRAGSEARAVEAGRRSEVGYRVRCGAVGERGEREK